MWCHIKGLSSGEKENVIMNLLLGEAKYLVYKIDVFQNWDTRRGLITIKLHLGASGHHRKHLELL